MIFLLVLKLEIRSRVIIISLEGFWFLLEDFLFFLKIRFVFCMLKYLSFHTSSFAVRCVLILMARPHSV